MDEFWPENLYLIDMLRSTGLYAKAGTIVEVTLAKELIGKIKVISKLHSFVIPLKNC